MKNRYESINFLLKCQKVLSEYTYDSLYCFIENYNSRLSEKNVEIIGDFLKTQKVNDYRKQFYSYGTSFAVRLKYPKDNDSKQRQGDLMVLKPYISDSEKGVLLIKYNESFEKFMSLFDVHRICKRYRIVLEPSTWGYQDVVFWLYKELRTDIIIQAQDEKDFCYAKSLGENVIPVRLGAGDWVDPGLFLNASDEKKYDVIMVASWQLLKRHRLFFDALAQIKEYIGKVCLIGYPCEGRTMEDIVADAEQRGIVDLIEIYENISPDQVAQKMSQAKCSVMLSKREGASKVLYESLFCDVPVVLSAENRGVNREIINEKSGIITSDEELAANLLQVVSSYKNFSPREWALRNTGYIYSHSVLNSCIQEKAVASGENWTQNIYLKKNTPNLVYVRDEDAVSADAEFFVLEDFLVR